MQLTVITGLSGAGKSEAMGAFEDAGWFCVDNLPPRLLPALAELFTHEGTPVQRAAVVCDVRGGPWFDELTREITRLAGAEGMITRVLFLEASDEALLNRFRATRRRHPLASGGEVLAGIARERELLAELRGRADLVVDTSGLTAYELRRVVSEAMMGPGAGPRLRVTFLSFGFSYGAPRDADLVLDVRFLRNPHYVPELQPLTGLDGAVADHVSADPSYHEFMLRLEALLDLLLPAYAHEGKRHLVVAIGCTGGRHRSVAIAERLTARYRNGRFDVSVTHRDITRAGAVTGASA
jgi:UPF0042 nucleotide-binding protein